MPSFDIVSEVEQHELTNAVDQANREITTRYDFKGVKAQFSLNDNAISLVAMSEFQLKQMMEILQLKCAKRKIDLACLQPQAIQSHLSDARQTILVQQGIDKEFAKKIIKTIKDSKLKVQTAIQGEQVRVTGKKRDDLQAAMQCIKAAELGIALQFTNFRD